MKLTGVLASVQEITASQREAMFGLMQRHYDNTSRATFEADLGEKQWVILLLDRDGGCVRGFSTQMLITARPGGRRIHALFSGDTIVDRRFWGDVALSHVWGRLALSLIDAMAGEPLYWLLVSKGFRTYRFLPVFFREFYPRHDSVTPPGIQRDLEALATAKFGWQYDAASGVVRTHGNKDRLREGLGELTAGRLRDPHLRFFVQRNPRHAQGEELCCLAPLSRENFTAAAYRVIHAGPAIPLNLS